MIIKKKIKDKKKDTVTLEVPRNIFSDPQVTAMLDRSKCTTRVTTGVVASVLKAAGANLEDFTRTLYTGKEIKRERRLLIK